jgi:hypothetical protein
MFNQKTVNAVVKSALLSVRGEVSTQAVMDALIADFGDQFKDVCPGKPGSVAYLPHAAAAMFANAIAEVTVDPNERKKVRGKLEVPLARACRKAELPFVVSLSIKDWDASDFATFAVKAAEAAEDPSEEMIACAAQLLELCGGSKSLAAKALAIAGSK